MAAALAAGLIHAQTGSAATHTWTGASDNNWGTPANWTSNAVPNSTTEDVFLVAPGAANLSINANTGTYTVRSLTFNDNTASNPVTLNVINTNTFTVNGQTGDDIIVTAGANRIVGANTGTELKLVSTDFNIASGASLELAARLGAGASSNSYNKNGAGTLIINASNGGSGGWNFTGGTFNVNGGVLEMKSTSAYGNSGDRWTVNTGAVLQLDSNYGSAQGGIVLNGGATLRSSGAFTVGTGTSNSGGNPGTIALGASSANLSTTSTLTIARAFSGAGGINKIGSGTVVLDQGKTDGSSGASQFPGGVFPQNTFTGNTTIAEGTLKLNAAASLATSPLISVAAGAAFNVTPNAAYAVASNQTVGGTGSVIGAVTMSNPGSTLAPGLVGTVGLLTLGDASNASPLTLNGGRVHFDLSTDATTATANDQLTINGDLNLNGSTRIAINRLNSALQSNSTYTLMTYTGALNGSASNLVLPNVRQGLSIIDPTTTPGQIQLSVGSGTAANLTWVGDNASNTWESNGAAGAQNWLNGAAPDAFFDWDSVTFDDNGSASPAVNVTGTLVPTNITLNNSIKSYTIGGSGTLTNVNSVTKNGTAAATFSNSGVNLFNTLTVNAGTLNLAAADTVGAATVNSGGALTVLGAATFTSLTSGGTVTIGDGATSGSGSISGSVTNNGTVVFNRPDDFAATTVISGTGTVIKNGNGVATLSGNSTYTGPTFINAGTAHPTLSTAFGSATAGGTVTIANGAVLDLGNVGTNTLNFGPRVFAVSGNGTGSGAIVNNSTTVTWAQQNALQKVQLLGDTTFGGTARFDVRANQAGGVNTASLDLGGHTLTKVGNMQFSIVGADVSDGNIVVNNGTLSVETTTKLQGTSSVNFAGDNTALQFFGNTDPSLVTRPFVFNGNTGTINQAAGGTAVLIGSDMVLNKSVTIQVGTGTLGNLTLNGNLSGAGGITKSGVNTLTLAGASNSYTGGTTLAAAGTGTLLTAGTLITNTKFSNGTLTVNSGLAKVAAKPTNNAASGLTVVPVVQVNGGSIDLTNNAMVVDYAPGNSPRDTVRGYLNSGYANGAWNGTGIASSSAAAASSTNAKTGIGYAEAAALPSAVPAGFVDKDGDTSSLILKYTLLGDANLDGTVNALDFNALASNYGASGSGVWTGGDFDYNTIVDTTDFNALAQNFNQVLPSSAGALGASLGTLVPEPGMVTLGAITALGMLSRRRRSR
jgi:autotransporter-associated beta strand protein